MKNMVWLNFLGFDIQAILLVCGVLFGIITLMSIIMYISYRRKNH